MTQVIFDVVDLVGEVHPGDIVSVWPPYVASTVDGRVRSTRKIDVLVDEGPVAEDIEPGPLVVQLQCRGIADTKPRTVTIPDEGTITLANLLQSTFTYTPAVVSQVSLDAQRAEDAAVRAENVVDTVQWQGDQLSVMGKVSPPLTGDAGATPHVGANGNWWVGDTDTGVRAQGPKGDSGDGAGDVLWSELNPVLDGKADIPWVNNALAPGGNHGGLIVDSQLLGSGEVVFNFPSKVSGQVTVRVTGRSPVTGNQALVGYMFRGPNGEKALEGMSGLQYSAAVGEPYRYLTVAAPNVDFTSSITVTPDPGWTLDGIVIRPWLEGAGNVLVTGVFVDTGLGPRVVTRDLNGGISVPLAPTSNASAVARGYVTARTPEIRVVSSLPSSPLPGVVYLVTG